MKKTETKILTNTISMPILTQKYIYIYIYIYMHIYCHILCWLIRYFDVVSRGCLAMIFKNSFQFLKTRKQKTMFGKLFF